MSAAAILKLVLGGFKKYWLHILIALVLAGAVYHYMDLRADKAAAEASAALEKKRADEAWAQVRRQNEEIKKAHEAYKGLQSVLETIVGNSNEERGKLDRLLGSLGLKIDDLKKKPPAPTKEKQCEAAADELRNLDEINLLFPSASGR